MPNVRKILLLLPDMPEGEGALTTALGLARRFGAAIEALHAGDDGREAVLAALTFDCLSTFQVGEIMAGAEQASRRRSLTAQGAFYRAVAREGIAVANPLVPERPQENGLIEVWPCTSRASFCSVVGRESDLLVHARRRLSDLIVMPQPDVGGETSALEVLHSVLFGTNQPVLITPRRVPATIGRRICVAWDGSREAIAATRSILPWLHDADAVQFLHMPESKSLGLDAVQLVDYLRSHGIRPELDKLGATGDDAGTGLLAACAKFGADLLSIGFCPQSRMRRRARGQITRQVLGKAELFVLLTH